MAVMSGSLSGFWVIGTEPRDPDFALITPEGRRTFYQEVGKLATAAYAVDRESGISASGQELAPLAEITKKRRRSAMGPADKEAPAFVPAHMLSRTIAFLRFRVTEKGVFFYWRNDPRVGSSWGTILDYHAQGLVPGAPARDVIGLSPRAFARVRQQAWEWWARNKARFLAGPVGPITSTGKQYYQVRHTTAHTQGGKPLQRNQKTGLYEGRFQQKAPRQRPAWAAKVWDAASRSESMVYRPEGMPVPRMFRNVVPRPTVPGPGKLSLNLSPPKPELRRDDIGVRFRIDPNRVLTSAVPLTTVELDVAQVDAILAVDQEYYVGPGGTIAPKPGAYDAVKRALDRARETGKPFNMPFLVIDTDGNLAIEDGRHRWAVLRDEGARTLPVAVRKYQAALLYQLFGTRQPYARH